MSKKISLFIVPEDPKSTQAQERLKEAFPQAMIDIVGVPALVERYYPCPFVREGEDGAYYGLGGIDTFILLRKERFSQLAGSGTPKAVKRKHKPKSRRRTQSRASA